MKHVHSYRLTYLIYICKLSVMVTPDAKDKWKVELLTTTQNGDNDAEVDRVLREHPGEDECVLDRRVLGTLAPFRCMSAHSDCPGTFV
jgi:hypothetical protein